MLRRSHFELLLILAIGLTGCGKADTTVLQVTPASFDFGRVRHSVVRVAEFTMTNNGTRPLRVTAKPNCGCFRILQGGQASLEPGESTSLRVRFDSGRLSPGPMRTKRVDIFTDDVNGAHAKVPMAGDVYKPLRMEPSELRLGRLTGNVDAVRPKPFRIRSTDPSARIDITDLKKDLKITIIPKNLFSVTAEQVSNGIDLHVRLLPNVRRPQGDVFAAIDIVVPVIPEGGNPKHPERVALRAGVTGHWVADTQGIVKRQQPADLPDLPQNK